MRVRIRHFYLPATLLLGALIGMSVDRLAYAQQQSGIRRTILTRIDDPSSSNYEAVMGIAELPPGLSAGKHRHYGVEIGYVLEGSLEVTHDGRPPMQLTAGQSFTNSAAHDAKNVGSTPAKILAVYVVEKGRPLAEPVR